MIWHILGILAFVVIYNIWRYNQEADSNDYGPNIEPEPKSRNIRDRHHVTPQSPIVYVYSASGISLHFVV